MDLVGKRSRPASPPVQTSLHVGLFLRQRLRSGPSKSSGTIRLETGMSRSLLSTLVAALLAATVLGVFYSHQWYGPVGTLQRYLLAAMEGDGATMEKLEYPPTSLFRAQLMHGYRGARNVNIRAQRPVGESRVWINTEIYNPRYRQIIVMSWVMVKRSDGWKVDILKTIQVNPWGR